MSDSKSLWKTLKSLGLPNKASQGSSNIGLNIDGEVCFDKLKVAEKFNSFYTSVAEKLVNKLPKISNKFGDNFVFNFYSSKGVKRDTFFFYCVRKQCS